MPPYKTLTPAPVPCRDTDKPGLSTETVSAPGHWANVEIPAAPEPSATLPRMDPATYQAWLEWLKAIADNEYAVRAAEESRVCGIRARLYFSGVRHRMDMAMGNGLVDLPELAQESKAAAIAREVEQMI